MKLTKSLLLGSAAAVVAVSAGYAADLPSKKAAPASYVKICDAYGAGFFYIPGTDTCLKVGGRVRADYGYYKAGDLKKYDGTVSTASAALNTEAWEARGRVELDARTQTSAGTVQTVAIIRGTRDGGNYNENAAPAATLSSTGTSGAFISANAATISLERAYIRWAGITAGANADNFSFMPGYNYEAAHWSSFTNGSKQLAYTAILGGGLSATVAIQDYNDTGAAKGVSSLASGATPGSLAAGSAWTPYNNFPLVVGRVDYAGSGFGVALRGAYHEAKGVATAGVGSVTAPYSATASTWAVGLGVSIDLPQLAAGDKLWLDGGFASGMSEYTINWASFKSATTKYLTAGYATNPASWAFNYGTGTIEAPKSWNLAANLLHYWAPNWRSNISVSGGAWSPTTNQLNALYDGSVGLGKGNVIGATAGLAYLPAKDFEVGVELAYNRVTQDVRSSSTVVTSQSDNGFGGRIRLERGF